MILLRHLVLCGSRLTCVNSNLYAYKSVTKVSIQTTYGQLQNCKHFHTTTPNRALPPIVWLILLPILQVGAIVFGRRLRKWWQGMSTKEKQKILLTLRQRNRTIVGNCMVLFSYI